MGGFRHPLADLCNWPAKPAVATFGHPIIEPVTHDAWNPTEVSKPGPWRPKFSRNLQGGVGSLENRRLLDEIDRVHRLRLAGSQVQDGTGGRPLQGAKTQAPASLMPENMVHDRQAKPAISVVEHDRMTLEVRHLRR